MATELVPVVDIRALSQPDLDALAAASAHALAPRTRPDADPLPPLRIDRAVFNESAGSRKQTFSRLRLAASSSSSSSSPASAAARHTSSSSSFAQRTYDPEAEIVAYHLRRLFVPDDPSLPPPPEPQTLATILPQDPSPSSPPDPDRETTNAKGVSVDLLRLAGTVGPYDAELHRRTAGMASDAALQGFIDSLAGKFISQRRRRKNVDASFFGDHLPRGWKLQLGIKRKGGHVWVHCFSYISPKGSKFSTCKEVSAYLMSLLGYPELKPPANQYESTGQHYLSANFGDDNVSGFQDQIGSIMDKTNVHSVPSLAFSSYSSDANDVGERNAGRVNAYECQKCNLTFGDRTSYVQHHLSYHEMSAKRRRTSKFGEPIVGKDGKFECPVCQKTFEEESRYFGHVGSHARYEGLTPEAFLDKATSRRETNDSSAEISFSLQDLTGSHGPNSKVSYGEAGFQHHNHSNEHGDNNSTVTELFSTNYSDNLIRTNKTWSRPEVAPSFNDAPSVCRYTNFTGHADVTVPERASISNSQSVSNINGFAGVAMFSDHPGSNHVVRPTAFGTANHYQGQIIDHSRAAPRHADNNTVKARDVNLNSCVNTISFPIANANNETSAALNEANRSSSTAKCFSGSFNNNGGASSASSCCGSTNQISSSFGTASKTQTVGSRCIGASYEPYGENFGALKDNPFASKNNTAVYQSNLGTQPVYAVASRADCFASGSMQTKNSDKEFASSAKEQIDNAKNRTSKEAGFVTEAYNRNAFSGGITEKGFAQFSKSFTQTKPNSSGRCSLPAPKTPTNGSDINCIKGSSANRGDVSFTKGSLVNRPISNNEPNVARAPGFYPHAAASASQNANGLVSVQANFGRMPSTVQSAADVSMTSTSQDQCDLQLGFGAQKQQIFSSHGQLRTATAGSPPPGSISKTSSLPTESSQFGSMNGPKSFPSGTSQFGGFARPTLVPAAPSQFGSMAQPNHVHSAQSSQFTSLVQSNSIPPAESSQFGRKAQSSSVPPAKTSQFRGMAGPNSGPPAQSSQFGSMTRPNSVPPESSQFFGSMARPNSQNSVPPVSSQFANMPSQNFVSASEPTLVLGYAPQIGSGPPPQVQSGWDLSLPRMVTGGSMVTCLCIWCNSQFHHFGPFDGQQPSSFGFICPTCKDRMSGHHNVPNNGSWQS